MMVFGQDQYMHDWVANQLGFPGFAGGAIGAFGIEKDGTVIGGVVFHNYYPDSGVVEMSAASINSRWLSARMIRAMFSYAFDLLECQMVIMRVGSDNSVMLNIAERFGYNIYTIPRLRGKDKDEAICTYTEEQWRSSKYNRKR